MNNTDQMVMALNSAPQAGDPGNVTYSLGYPHTPHQTTMPDLGSALKAQQNMQNILNLPTTLHGKGSMLDGPPMHLAGEVVYPPMGRFVPFDPADPVTSHQRFENTGIYPSGQKLLPANPPGNVIPFTPRAIDKYLR